MLKHVQAVAYVAGRISVRVQHGLMKAQWNKDGEDDENHSRE
ncbi:MAG: hypothetical protein ACREOQ_15100 [Gemmatimonadales bacterium]